MLHRSRSALLLLTLLAALAAATAAEAPSPAAPTLEPPLRALWARSNLRYQRQWLMLGPVAEALADEGNLHASAGDNRWRPGYSWGDVIAVAGLLGSPEYRGSAASPEVAYAFATLNRDRDGDALLSFGSSVPARIWVNGVLVRSISAARRLTLDQDRITVQLRRGENALIIRTDHTSGPWLFAVRVLEAGTVLPAPRLTPTIVSETPSRVTISTDIPERYSPVLVDVSVVGAGGRVIAHEAVPRGKDISFDKTRWTEGAYEVRLQTPTPWKEPDVAHLDAYHGDRQAAAARLLAAAKSAPYDTAGATVRMLADMVLDRIGGSLEKAADDGWSRIDSPLMEYEELLLEAAGKPGRVRPWGFVRIAYTDDTDGSTQYCRAYLPPNYSAKMPSPTVLFLHGYNPPNPPYVGWWAAADRHNEYADRRNVIYIEPHGRGNSQYLGIGDKDVLRCLETAKERLKIDEDRVYLAGESMGGSGAWLVASRHPDLFAAVAITHGGWDYRIVPGRGFDNPQATRPLERFAAEAQSSFVGAESLLNLPVMVRHGDVDQAVSIDFSRHAVRMLDGWGYDVRYEEIPGRGHEDLGIRDKNIEWLLTHRRDAAPRHVRIRAVNLSGASAYWFQVDSWREPLEVMRVDAEVLEPGVIRIDTENVVGATLTLPPQFRGSGPVVRVVWNGLDWGVNLDAQGRVTIASASARPIAGGKRRDLEGSLSDLFATPFAIVIGTTSPDPRMQGYCREKGEALAQLWKTWQHEMPRVFKDTEVTDEIEKQYSLFLVGGSGENKVTARLIGRLPLEIAHDAVTIDGRRFPATDAYVQFIHPNPSAPSRYVLVVAATSTDGMYFWNPATYWDQVYGFPNSAIDWNIVDGRKIALDPGLGRDRAWIASGVFDRAWRRDDRWVFTGDESVRAKSPLRHAPGTPIVVPAALLDAYAGTYQLFPGLNATIAHSGDGLTLSTAGSPPAPLIAESPTDFATPLTANLISFERDASGKVTGFTSDFNGSLYHVTRVP